MTAEEIKHIKPERYPMSEVGLRDECKMILKVAKYICSEVDKPIRFIKI